MQYKVDDGAWVDWLVDTAQTSAVFGPASPVAVQKGHTYHFHLVAGIRDNVGNQSAVSAEASTEVVTNIYIYLPVILKNYTPPFYGPDEIEPNDDAKTQANGPIISGRTYLGKLPPGDSKDYFYIDLQEAHSIEAWLSNIPAGQDYDLVLRDVNLKMLEWGQNTGSADEHILSESLPPGRYYIQVNLVPGSSGSEGVYQVRAVYQ